MFVDSSLIAFLAVLTSAHCHTKLWKAANVWPSENWFNSIPPSCPDDRIFFPESEAVSLTVPADLQFKELILPLHGELVLDDEIHQFQQNAKADCKGRDVFYNASAPVSWFDPSGWTLEPMDVETDSFIWDPVKNADAVPHLNRIPCEKDVIKFPSRAAFIVNFENKNVTAARWMLGETNVTEANLEEMFSSYDAGFRFLNQPVEKTVTLVPSGECKVRDCFCDPEELRKHLPLVCSTPGATCDYSEKRCDNAVHPEGHCCPICGALVHIRVPRENFLLSVYEKLLVRHLLLPEANAVQGYLGVTKTEVDVIHMQAIFTDKGDASRSIALAKMIEQELKQDMLHENVFGVASLTADYSGFAYDYSAAQDFIDAFVAILLIALFVYCCFYVYKTYIADRRPSGSEAFTFARFENNPEGTGSVQVTVETGKPVPESDSVSITTQSTSLQSPMSPGEMIPPEDTVVPFAFLRKQFRRLSSTFSRNFINPLFGNPVAEMYAPTVNLSSLVRDAPTMDNPFYEVATEQGLTDQDLGKEFPPGEVAQIGESLEISEASTSTGYVEELPLAQPVLTPIAEENYEEVSLEESKEASVSTGKGNEKSDIAQGQKNPQKTKKKDIKNALKRVLRAKKSEDSDNLVEREESEA